MRMFNGTYDASKLQEIRKFGGSEVYARIVSMKCRGASSLLRDIYLGPERPWGLGPDEDPEIPPEILDAIKQLVTAESDGLSQTGAPPDPGAIRDRVTNLIEAARDAAKRRAKDQAKVSGGEARRNPWSRWPLLRRLRRIPHRPAAVPPTP